MHILNGRVFGIFPSVPFIPSRGIAWRSLECAEGACIVRRPSYMHHPPIAVVLSESTPSTLYLHSLFCVNPPSSWPSSSFNSCFVCTLVRLRTPSYIRIVPVETVDGERKAEMEIRRERGRKGVREEGDERERQGKHEISRTKGATAVCA